MSTLEALCKEKNGWTRVGWKAALDLLIGSKMRVYQSKGKGNKARKRVKQLQSS